MISSTSSSDRVLRPDNVVAASPSAARPYSQGPDRISTAGAAFLREALERQPAVRPAVVERGRALVADANYPALVIIEWVAAQIINSPDLSEDQS